MDTLLTTWEMNLELEQFSAACEEVAICPSEPYILDWESLNWS